MECKSSNGDPVKSCYEPGEASIFKDLLELDNFQENCVSGTYHQSAAFPASVTPPLAHISAESFPRKPWITSESSMDVIYSRLREGGQNVEAPDPHATLPLMNMFGENTINQAVSPLFNLKYKNQGMARAYDYKTASNGFDLKTSNSTVRVGVDEDRNRVCSIEADNECARFHAHIHDNGAQSSGSRSVSFYQSNAAKVVLNSDNTRDHVRSREECRRRPSSVGDVSQGTPYLAERMKCALNHYAAVSEGEFLSQVWLPTDVGNRGVLTTIGQPFLIHAHRGSSVLLFRELSTKYIFSAETDTDPEVLPGLPGRVFTSRFPEWTPNVQYYDANEYLRINDAKKCNVRGSLAVPVLEWGSRRCIAVVEVVLLLEKTEYSKEIENMCGALKEVNLYSSVDAQINRMPRQIIPKEGRQAALREIFEVLNAACETFKLPLAQTWVPVEQNSGLVDMASNRLQLCTGDGPYFVLDNGVRGFRQACTEHILERDQGAPGKAVLSNAPFFSSDIRRFTKTQYPLCHYARMYELRAAVAVRLRSLHTEECDYVLEFFFPQSCCESEQHQYLLNALSVTLQCTCRSLHTITRNEVEDSRISCSEPIPCDPRNGRTLHCNYESTSKSSFMQKKTAGGSSLVPLASEGSSEDSMSSIVDQEDGYCNTLVDTHHSTSMSRSCNAVNNGHGNMPSIGDGNVTALQFEHVFEDSERTRVRNTEVCQMKNGAREIKDPERRGPTDLFFPQIPSSDASSSVEGLRSSVPQVRNERRRGSMEKYISLDRLQQYFSGSLKDAAKDIGVCPTTLKRICRQHGILRWPCRKINKVNRSLIKLQGVIDSVQGIDGPLYIRSLMNRLGSPMLAEEHAKLDDGSQYLSFSNSEHQSRGSCSSFSPISIELGGSTSFLNGSHYGINPLSIGDTDNSVDQTGKQKVACDKFPEPCPDLRFRKQELRTSVRASTAPMESSPKFHHDNSCKQTMASLQNKDSKCHSHSGSGGSSDNRSTTSASNTGQIDDINTHVTVKATYRDDTARFKIRLESSLESLRQEIQNRFKLTQESYKVKYLDDEADWAILSCDADLAECMDILRSTGSSYIKLMITS
ncbi:hypothetical protein KP509_21G019500 [Ceratopteris richardii]|uniref:Uncharacterized protein n=2 Tax=Ceratopteris richardii TaxID=49495 RepID=A0A8T2SAQ6_CERRI|nr:hypothetical protein KP509_21G019500 [Ceratopteris richardii]